MGAELTAVVAPPEVSEIDTGLEFNEVAAGGAGEFWVELTNAGEESIDLAGYVIRWSKGDECVLPSGSIGPGELVVIIRRRAWILAVRGRQAVPRARDGAVVLDAVVITNALQGQSPEFPGRWLCRTRPRPARLIFSRSATTW